MDFDMKTAPTRAEALADLLAHWSPDPPVEYVPVEDALGRITAQEIFSRNTLPICRVSSFDGYAVKSAAFANGIPDGTGWQLGIDYVPADTGDDFPDEYDSVVAVEDVDVDETGFHVHADLDFIPGDCTRPAGSTIKQGDLLAEAHRPITGELMSLFACGGIDLIPVLKKPRIGFIPTGSELVPAGTHPVRGQNIETNGLMLWAKARELGCDLVRLPVVPDDRALLAQALDDALAACDMVILNGGSSKGGEDYNAELLQERGSYFHHGVRAVPGRPVGLSIIDGKPALNFPGPPLAAWLCANWLMTGLACHWYGIPTPKRPTVRAVITEDIKKGPFIELQAVMHIERTEEGLIASQIPRGAGDQVLRLMNGLLIVPVGSKGFAAGDEAEIELLVDEAQI